MYSTVPMVSNASNFVNEVDLVVNVPITILKGDLTQRKESSVCIRVPYLNILRVGVPGVF